MCEEPALAPAARSRPESTRSDIDALQRQVAECPDAIDPAADNQNADYRDCL